MEQKQLGHQNCLDMKRCLVAFLSCLICGNGFAMSVMVKHIVDGDTFVADVLMKDKTVVNSVKVRLSNVDTPEIHGQCEYEIARAAVAKQRLGELIPVGSVIEIKNVKDDKYAGRIDAHVYDKSGRDVGNILIKEKVGRPYSGGRRQSWCDKK